MVVSFVIWRRAVYLLDVHKLRWRDKNISYTALGLIVVTAHAWYRIVLLSLERRAPPIAWLCWLHAAKILLLIARTRTDDSGP